MEPCSGAAESSGPAIGSVTTERGPLETADGWTAWPSADACGGACSVLDACGVGAWSAADADRTVPKQQHAHSPTLAQAKANGFMGFRIPRLEPPTQVGLCLGRWSIGLS